MLNSYWKPPESARSFRQGPIDLEVLRGVSLEVRAGERIAIIGASGSGKTTLLQILGGLDRPTLGHGARRRAATSMRSTSARAASCAIARSASSTSSITCCRNSPRSRTSRCRCSCGARRSTRPTERARAILARVGLGERLIHRPHELSGGERQRAAVARALVTGPRIVLADEPTGNLDGGNADSVFALMLELNRELATSLVVVTHDRKLAARMDRILELDRGNLVERV